MEPDAGMSTKDVRLSVGTIQSMGRRSLTGQIKSLSRVAVRRKSFGFSSVPGIKPVDRTSQIGVDFKRPPLTYLPTYQLEPRTPFNVYEVTKEVNKVIDSLFTGHKYDARMSPPLALNISAELMHAIKAMSYTRYRIITVVTIGQKRSQSYNNAIGFIWDTERDRYVDTHREETTCFCQATVFAVYLD
ncbi:dynein light chain Tctex-type protein 2B-like [Pectinophora gossypiella]|uniref:dynein light chain Tctex-type protein 2B-like n=1 Tax=Pectinophora gossypiella TaxID=13191 RepID=UPI00214E87B5|nr:dynein light chain Tctex-type protein 2B-like [Pectinophora gossypiella]